MQSITILVGLSDAEGNALPAQLLAPDTLTADAVLVALRQAEGQAIAAALQAAEQRGREAATQEEQEAKDDVTEP